MSRSGASFALSGATRGMGARYVALGDSITIAGDTVSGSTLATLDSFALYFTLLSQGKVHFVRNAGHGGNTAADMLARFDTDVTPYAPAIVSLQAGTNDFIFGVTDATYRTNIKTLVAKIRGIGATPILLTMPPVNGGSAGQKQQIMRNNMWLSYYTASQGIPLVDMWGIVADPLTGNYLAAMDNGDGIHPSVAGRFAIGQAMINAIGPLLVTVPLVTRNAVDPLNIIPNGLMTGSPVSGIAPNWAITGSPPSGYSTSVVTDTLVPGNMQRISLSASTGSATVRTAPAVGSGFNVGDVLRFSAVVTNNQVRTQIAIQNFGGSAQLNYAQFDKALTRGTLVLPDFTVPVGTTNILCDLSAKDAGFATTGNADFGQVTIYNLTTGVLTTL